MRRTQNEMILDHLKRCGSINPMEALYLYGIMRLASRINDLKKDGVPILDRRVSGKNRFGETVSYSEYRLGDEYHGENEASVSDRDYGSV